MPMINENEDNDFILNFSNADRVRYGDNSYPSTIIPMEGDNGEIGNRRVFIDGNSQLYSMDGNTPRPVVMTYNLPEVAVTSPRLHRPLAASINDLSINSNDNTQVNNIPYGRYDAPRKEYNQHLRERALNGMAQEGAWRKAHPNQAAWSDALAAAPFAVAGIPFITGVGQAVGDTAFGSAAADAIGSAFASPLGRVINAGLGYYGLKEGVNDITNGKFTPGTAMDLLPFLQMARPVETSMKKRLIEASKYAKNGIVAGISQYSIQPSRMNAVNARFRNSEWNNFLATRNGDNYYRMVNSSQDSYSPNADYFVSHTTPWEEFVNTNIDADPKNLYDGRWQQGIAKLYEFPTATFGKRMASNDVGVITNNDVSIMGKKHLLYGNTSSGKRDFVKYLSDKATSHINESPYIIGIKDRPLAPNGLYDGMPNYENIHLGNQTVINGEELQNAIQNSTYNLFEQSPYGIIRKIHIGK